MDEIPRDLLNILIILFLVTTISILMIGSIKNNQNLQLISFTLALVLVVYAIAKLLFTDVIFLTIPIVNLLPFLGILGLSTQLLKSKQSSSVTQE